MPFLSCGTPGKMSTALMKPWRFCGQICIIENQVVDRLEILFAIIAIDDESLPKRLPFMHRL